MKHINSYENNVSDKSNYYWKTTLKIPNFIISLRKIGVPEDKIKEYDQLFIDEDFEIFILNLYNKKTNKCYWTYTKNSGFFDLSYKYMGEIEINEYEIDSYKYNL